MTEPPPALTSSGIPNRQPRKVPKRSSFIARQNSSSGASTAVLSCAVEPPALLCSTSSRPNVSIAVRIAFWMLSGSVTTERIAIAPFPANRAVSSPAPASISAIATLAPSRANAIAVARPIPVPPPVISATLPCSLGIGASFSALAPHDSTFATNTAIADASWSGEGRLRGIFTHTPHRHPSPSRGSCVAMPFHARKIKDSPALSSGPLCRRVSAVSITGMRDPFGLWASRQWVT